LYLVPLAKLRKHTAGFRPLKRRIGDQRIDILAQQHVPVHLRLDILIEVSNGRLDGRRAERQLQVVSQAPNQCMHGQVSFTQGELVMEYTA
jgi:hypothetical protein